MTTGDGVNPMLSAATRCFGAGLCVLPAIVPEKRPALPRWKQYQRRLPTAPNSTGGSAMPMGCVSSRALSPATWR